MEKIDFRKAYPLPLYLDSYGSYAFTKENQMAFEFEFNPVVELSIEQKREIVDAVNSGKPLNKYKVTIQDVRIKAEENKSSYGIIEVRGWGHLTGTGGLRLDFGEAIKIQQDFTNYIASVL